MWFSGFDKRKKIQSISFGDRCLDRYQADVDKQNCGVLLKEGGGKLLKIGALISAME
jgi:hypothetical protein